VIVNGDIRHRPVQPRRSRRRRRRRDDRGGATAGRGSPDRSQRRATGRDPGPPPLDRQRDIAIAHVDSMLAHYGRHLGLRNARKHVGWYLESSGRPAAVVKAWRARLCQDDDSARVMRHLSEFYSEPEAMAA
jgi:tRNA-dihydrouridine synthase